MIDEMSFTQFYDDEIWGVYAFFGYRVHSKETAEDLTQLTFEKALRAWSRFDRSKASPRTWLLAIARNVLIDHYRRGRGEAEDAIGGGHEVVYALGIEAAPPSPGLSPDLEQALGTLGNRDREILALRFGADLSGPEIAELMELSLANVQQILSRSLRR